MTTYKAVNLPANDLAYTNKVFVSPSEYQRLLAQSRREPVYVEISGFVLTVQPHPKLTEGIAMSKFIREMGRISLVDNLTLKIFQSPADFYLGFANIDVELIGRKKGGSAVEIPEEVLESKFRECMNDMVLNHNQTLLFDYQGMPLQMTIKRLTSMDLINPTPQEESTPCQRGILHPQTSLQFESISPVNLEIISQKIRTINIFDSKRFNFEELGIGGLDKEFQYIVRRAFASRLLPPQIIQRLGLKYVKGMLLYGPPGTGKTLIARQIAKCLKAREPKIISGPEIFNKYVGQSEENIRDLFKEAEQEQAAKGDKSQLHIIIFDEIDAICRPRGTISGSTGVHDTVVNQLLSKIDGINSLNNILIIGMTNRKDMIDEAVLRPGRLEIHVEVGLPDEEGRQQILRIHTKKIQEYGALAEDVDLLEIAKITKNYSGAEIEGLVKNAASFAFGREIDLEDLGKEINVDNIKIRMADFIKGVEEYKPQFGIDEADLNRYIRGGIINYGETCEKLVETCKTLIEQVKTSPRTPLMSILLEGPPGTGKTALAAMLALHSGFPYVKLVSPENYVGFTESGKVTAIAKVFEDAYRSPLSLVVLDNIERLIEYVTIGPRFSNPILQAILVLTKKVPPHPDRRIMIIGTTSNATFLEDLDLVKSFNVVLEVKKLASRAEVAAVLRKYPVSEEELADILTDMTAISIKQLMLALEMSLQGEETLTKERFLSCLNSILL
ncbi:unnamed protein product [Blepharisma stoltei]|uniref:Vesicle-fusing ATPase n=1 Tax=Blepharisma stoltei TaxID=1481888 RepID=A0AAU9IUV5_9CILI|nr:unnamed protein product [Blepharisma stoltei]